VNEGSNFLGNLPFVKNNMFMMVPMATDMMSRKHH